MRVLFAPPPKTSIGDFEFSIKDSAFLMAFSSATGLRAMLLSIGSSLVSSIAISSGSSICTAPGLSSSANLKASLTLAGIISAEAI